MPANQTGGSVPIIRTCAYHRHSSAMNMTTAAVGRMSRQSYAILTGGASVTLLFQLVNVRSLCPLDFIS